MCVCVCVCVCMCVCVCVCVNLRLVIASVLVLVGKAGVYLTGHFIEQLESTAGIEQRHTGLASVHGW